MIRTCCRNISVALFRVFHADSTVFHSIIIFFFQYLIFLWRNCSGVSWVWASHGLLVFVLTRNSWCSCILFIAFLILKILPDFIRFLSPCSLKNRINFALSLLSLSWICVVLVWWRGSRPVDAWEVPMRSWKTQYEGYNGISHLNPIEIELMAWFGQKLIHRKDFAAGF